MKEYWSSLSFGRKVRLIITLLLVICVITFAARNWRSTEVIFVFFRLELPLTLIILLSGAVGFATASLFDYRKFKVRDAEIKRLNEELARKTETVN